MFRKQIRKQLQSVVLACAVLGGAGCTTETVSSSSTTTAPVQTESAVRQVGVSTQGELAAQINAERVNRGLSALPLNPKLSLAAQRHANDMAAKGYFSHYGQNGSTPKDRLNAVGYRYCVMTENISSSYPTVEQAVAGWMGSSQHRSNMLNRKVTEFGVGEAAGGLRVAVFTKPC